MSTQSTFQPSWQKKLSVVTTSKTQTAYKVSNGALKFLLKDTHIWKWSRAKLLKAWTLCCAVDSDTTVPLWSREADSLCCTHVDILQRQQRCYSLFNRLSHTITQRTTWNNITHTSFEIKTEQDKAFHVNSWRYSSIMSEVTIPIIYAHSGWDRKKQSAQWRNYFISSLFLKPHCECEPWKSKCLCNLLSITWGS